MKKKEYVTSITLKNNIKIDVGFDDYGQSYFIEYVDEQGISRTECCGSYYPWQTYILDRFGEEYEK